VLPSGGKVFVSVKDSDKKHILEPVRKIVAAGFEIIATGGTASYLNEHGVETERVNKVKEGRPHCVDAIKSQQIAMVFNTTFGAQSIIDSFSIRREALMNNIAYFTTVAGIRAAVDGILAMKRESLDSTPIQEYYPN
ncbi:MAG: carbamoyl phosphate synthase large subunit, partial [Nitrospinaceae bacterium]|nr:carbamoyl phosphate synthase large subunit [Nitrospinaceae bacterium]